MKVTDNKDGTVIVSDFDAAEFLASDRAKNPQVYALYDHMMAQMNRSHPLRPAVKTWIVGGKEYARCSCGKIVRINKPLIGSLHLCG